MSSIIQTIKSSYPSPDGKGSSISENLKSCQGPVLDCMGSRKRRASYLNVSYLNEQVILLCTANRRLHKALTYCSVDYSVDYSGESED